MVMNKIIRLIVKSAICLCILTLSFILADGESKASASVKSRYRETLNNIYINGMNVFVKYDADCTFGGKYPSEKEGYPYYLSPGEAAEGQVKYTDLNNDGIKEMVLKTNEDWHIFTQIKKKVKYAATITARNDGGWLSVKKGKKVFIVSTYGGRMTQSYVFRLKGGILKKVCMIGEQVAFDANEQPYSEYYYNDERTSERKYKTIYKKYVGSAAQVAIH